MKEKELREWFSIADTDFNAAVFLQTMHPLPLEIICYHCQQAGEKYLKAFLYYSDKIIPKTYDLTKLCRLCSEIDGSFRDLEDDSVVLSVYATGTCYPDREEILDVDMKSALKSAKKIGDFVKNKINIPEPTQ